MTKRTLIIVSFFAISTTFAQGRIDCKAKYEELEGYYKTSFPEKKIFTQTDKEEISSLIEDLLAECPSYRKEIYLYSEEIFLKIINPMNFGTERLYWSQYLLSVYDKYEENFPETKPENSQKKIIFSYHNRLYSSKEEALKAFDEVFSENKQYFSVSALLIYADLLTQQGNQEYETSMYLKKINALNKSILAKISELEQQKNNEIDPLILKKINTDIASLKMATKNIGFDKIKFNCDQLIGFFQSDFEENKTDLQWLDQTLKIFVEQQCFADNDFFDQVVHTYYQVEKNAQSAFYMGFLAQQKKEYQQAITNLDEAAQLEINNIKKAEIYYQIATIYSKNEKAERKEYLEKALVNNPKMLTACLLLAQLYTDAQRECFPDDFTYKTRYYLAIQLLETFAKNNPNYQKAVLATIKEYQEKAPTKKEIKKAKIKGKTIKINCWINQELKLPK